MSDKTDIAVLRSEIRKTLQLVERQARAYGDFLDTDFVQLGRKYVSAVVVAEFLCNFYTCCETLFMRVSQFFENQLQAEKWHQDLLDKMTLSIEGVRAAVIADSTRDLLRELLKFRHFRRYYFESDYDWDRLDYLRKKYEQARDMLTADLGRFEAFLERLADAVPGGD